MRVRGLALLFVVVGVSEAAACSCRPTSRAQTVAGADLVVTGRVLAVEPLAHRRRAVIRVEAVERGPRLSQVRIETPASSAACGAQLPLGARITVAAQWREGGYHTNSCLQLGLGRR